MHPLPIDGAVVDECRALAARVADGVHRFIDRHTTCSIERTVLRAYGVDGADPDGVPLVNSCVERVRADGRLGRGIAWFLGQKIARGAAGPQEAAEAIAYGSEPLGDDVPPEEVQAALAPHTQ